MIRLTRHESYHTPYERCRFCDAVIVHRAPVVEIHGEDKDAEGVYHYHCVGKAIGLGMRETERVTRRTPRAPDAEQMIIACCLIDEESVEISCAALETSDFFSFETQTVFETITDLHRKGQSVDIVMVAEHLRERESYDSVGGGTWLTQIIEDLVSTTALKDYIRLVLEAAAKRELLKALDDRSYLVADTIEECFRSARDAIVAPYKKFMEFGTNIHG